VITAAARGIFGLLESLEVRGCAHLPDTGSVVLAANHLTNFDVFPMQLALPRPIFFMGKEELFRHPLLNWPLRQLGGFPVRRAPRAGQLSDTWAMHHAAKVLQRGLVLGIFPEGTRSHGRGLAPAKTGAARLALAHGCPLIPLAVAGTEAIGPGRRRARVTITLGAPLAPRAAESPAELTERLMRALAAMLPPELRGVYGSADSGGPRS
jgi:1-acyl-sn-glycerol-3-phosphate acyltransferase